MKHISIAFTGRKYWRVFIPLLVLMITACASEKHSEYQFVRSPGGNLQQVIYLEAPARNWQLTLSSGYHEKTRTYSIALSMPISSEPENITRHSYQDIKLHETTMTPIRVAPLSGGFVEIHRNEQRLIVDLTVRDKTFWANGEYPLEIDQESH